MRLRKASSLAATAVALALTATACAGSDNDGLTIGIKFDQPGLGLKTPDNAYVGLDVDVATYVAGELGVDGADITWEEAPSSERENLLKRGDVDFIVATYSITEERDKLVDFAGPYFLAHQDLLIRADDEVASEDDINDLTLCSVSGSTSAQNVKDTIAPRADLHEFGTYSECLTGLENGTVDALTTDDAILAGYAAQEGNVGKFKLAGLSLSDEYYGIGVPDGETELRDDINAALEKMVEEGAWEQAVKDNLGPGDYDYEPVPDIGRMPY